MGVYVKGMEMPKEPVAIIICPDSKVFRVSYPEQIAEAIPVPPHGDLIDRKTAYDSLLDGMVMTGYQSRALDCISDFFVPTILMAEEGE